MPIQMNLPGITGESQMANYERWHTLTSFTWGGTRVSRAQSARDMRASAQVWTPQLRNVVVQRVADGQTATIWNALFSAQRFPLVKFEWVRTGEGAPVSYFAIEIRTARIVSVRDTSSGSQPLEEIEFLYNEVTVGTRNVGNTLTGAQDLVTYSIPTHVGG